MLKMTIFETVLVGIGSSLIATFIFLYLNWLVKSILIPWYEDKIYRGVRVNGHWVIDEWDENKLGNNAPIRATFEIKQKADQIKGIYTHTIVKEKEEDTTSYVIKGEIRNTYLAATSWPISDEQLDAGTYMLRVHSQDGLKMKGMLSFVSHTTGEVSGSNVVFKKKESQQLLKPVCPKLASRSRLSKH